MNNSQNKQIVKKTEAEIIIAKLKASLTSNKLDEEVESFINKQSELIKQLRTAQNQALPNWE